MIYGIIELDWKEPVERETICKMGRIPSKSEDDLCLHTAGNIGIGIRKTGVSTIDENSRFASNENRTIGVALEGNIFNHFEMGSSSKNSSKLDAQNVAAKVLKAYEDIGEKCIEKLNGGFVIVIWDKNKRQIIVARDKLGIEPLFYYLDDKRLIFASSVQGVLNHKKINKQINYNALYRFLLFNYNPGQDSFFLKINKLRPGHYLIVNNKNVSIERYWFLSYSRIINKHEEACTQDLLNLIKEAISIRVSDQGQKVGAFISGGMDSSSVVGLMSTIVDRPIQTFSFRCLGESFDESNYARLVSRYYHSDHHEIVYGPENVALIEEVVDYMAEPFCDLGIEIASYILGRAARDKVSYVLTGDGGDELFGGHPVYVADKVANAFEKIPYFLRRQLTKSFQLLPDSDKKKNFLVKTKRFSYNVGFPAELYSNRWRVYYTDEELKKLCAKELINEFHRMDPFADVIEFYREADGADYLSKSLYGDYNTVVDFYLRRMGLIRGFAVEGRFPLLDPSLVEYAATIPSRWKIKGFSNAKYIFKKTMEGTLPNEIVYRKDKLGHSVPMKNWMRESPLVKEMMLDVLSESAIKRRGYFNFHYIHKMIDEHLKKSHNHSHRLWALTVLELWLSKNFE